MSKSRYVIYVSDQETPELEAWLQSMPKGSRSERITAVLAWAISSPVIGEVRGEPTVKTMPAQTKTSVVPAAKRKMPPPAPRRHLVAEAPSASIPTVPVTQAHEHAPEPIEPQGQEPVPATPAATADEMAALDMMWSIGG